MTKHALYNCKHAGDQYRITKFDSDANVEASYLTDGIECDCPAGVRPTCRHRKMLPLFKASKGTNGNMFYDFDAGTWLEIGEPGAADESAEEWADGVVPELDATSESIQTDESGLELDEPEDGDIPGTGEDPDWQEQSAPSNQPDRSALRRI